MRPATRNHPLPPAPAGQQRVALDQPYNYPIGLRLALVVSVISQMDLRGNDAFATFCKTLVHDGEWPQADHKNQPHLTRLYEHLVEDARAWANAKFPGFRLGDKPALRKAVRRFLVDNLMARGTLEDAPPPPPPPPAHAEDLAKLRHLLMDGYVTLEGYFRLFCSLRDAMLRVPEIAALVDYIGPNPKKVYEKLTELFPTIKKVACKVKKARNLVTTRNCALEISGLRDVTPREPWTKLDWLKPKLSTPWRYHPSLLWHQVFVDAFTVRPKEVIKGERVIWDTTHHQPKQMFPSENASIGKYPVFMVYLAVHPKFGLRAYFPCSGELIFVYAFVCLCTE